MNYHIRMIGLLQTIDFKDIKLLANNAYVCLIHAIPTFFCKVYADFNAVIIYFYYPGHFNYIWCNYSGRRTLTKVWRQYTVALLGLRAEVEFRKLSFTFRSFAALRIWQSAAWPVSWTSFRKVLTNQLGVYTLCRFARWAVNRPHQVAYAAWSRQSGRHRHRHRAAR